MTIQQALDQKVWAVIGATHKTEKFGYKIYKCLKDHGYEVYPVNPNIAEIAKNLAFLLCGCNRGRINHLLLKKHML